MVSARSPRHEMGMDGQSHTPDGLLPGKKSPVPMKFGNAKALGPIWIVASVGIREPSRNSHRRPDALPGAHLAYLSLTCYRSNQLEFTAYECQFQARCLDYLATRSNHQGLSPSLRTQLHDSNSSHAATMMCSSFTFFSPWRYTTHSGCVFYSPLLGFSLLAYEVT